VKTREEKIQVRITGRQEVRYDQIVSMTKDEWEELKRIHEDEIGESAEGWLDLGDISDSDTMEDVEMTVVENGVAVKPMDQYGA
jgi:hypothetical protein